MQFIDGVGSLVKGGVKLGGKIAKGAKAVKELEKGARLAELAKTFVVGAKDSSELNSAVSKAAKVAKLRIVREAEEVKKVEKAASAAEKFRSELDVLKQRAREIPRTLTDDEIRACEAVKLQMKRKLPESGKISVAEVEKIDEAVRATNEAEEVKSVIKSDIPYQDATGKWHRANGQFALNTEVGIISGSSHYLSRPYIRKETIEAVNANTRVDYKTGQIYDSISKKWVEPSNVELGHKTGKEFAYLRDWAESQGMTQSQFNDFMNNPEFYAWQNISSNRSHMFEAKN